ncbi:MAG TPA: helix-turn-helix domain-containing protein [Rhizomicrobium sp.]|jgi:HTH-type transcriptional regulator/antitoxin HigA|nr:helix-turn-helix domain-containing protein [Rhizomicrobium sp.]
MKATLILIENDSDHAQAKALVDRLMISDNLADSAKLAAQARLIEDYERRRWPQKASALADILIYLLDQHGLTRADLVPLLGTPSRVSEVLSGKRELSIAMIQRLRKRFHISADVLIPSAHSRKKAAA